MSEINQADEVLMLQFRRKLQALQNIRGDGTSMITLFIPPDYQVSRANHMLIEELGKASNIKSRVNRQSVEDAIKTAQAKLKIYNRLPSNGIVLYCGNGLVNGKEKKLSIVVEPLQPLTSSAYLCDNRFHTEPLEKMLTNTNTYAFIIVDGSGVLYATLSGNNKTILGSFTVDLPHKHGRGGQSALRFARLRLEAHHNYIRKVIEQAIKIFITNDQVNVKGIVFAGSAQFKDKIMESNLMDPRLKQKIIGSLDIAYGGNAGFEQAVQAAAPLLNDVKYLDEKKILLEFFNEIHRDGNYIFGLKDTLEALKAGAVEKLILYEDSLLFYPETNKDEEPILLVDWTLENASKFGTKLYIVSQSTSDGNQFVKGFGGFGGILRYKIEMQEDDEIDDTYNAEVDFI
jgi:peptide chain release factor subunit 1